MRQILFWILVSLTPAYNLFLESPHGWLERVAPALMADPWGAPEPGGAW
jgi:hypothetical protein